MKKMILALSLFLSVAGFTNAKAQVGVNVNINIGAQPVWGPIGYDYVDYYYLPDIETYYYVPTHQFIYLSGGRWVFAYSLPPAYRGYDLYNGYKVVINQPRAYQYYSTDKVRYGRYRDNHSQMIIRGSNNPKYYVVKGHPKYNRGGNSYKARGNNGRMKGGGKGKGKGRG
ncbi:MAG TPA: hypothetical protein VF487_21035 [Chitinophagaceae bacterium]